VQQLVHLDLLVLVQLLLVLELQAAESQHCLVSNLGVFVEQVGQHGLTHELQNVKRRLHFVPAERVESLQRQDHHLRLLFYDLLVLSLRQLLQLFLVFNAKTQVQQKQEAVVVKQSLQVLDLFGFKVLGVVFGVFIDVYALVEHYTVVTTLYVVHHVESH